MSREKEDAVILALFAFRLRPEAHDEFEPTVGRMVALVQQVPGFTSMGLFRSEDGRTLAVPRFESEEALLAWRNHPDHLAAQEQGRDFFFDDYWIDVCSTIRSYEFHRDDRRDKAARSHTVATSRTST